MAVIRRDRVRVRERGWQAEPPERYFVALDLISVPITGQTSTGPTSRSHDGCRQPDKGRYAAALTVSSEGPCPSSLPNGAKAQARVGDDGGHSFQFGLGEEDGASESDDM